MPSSVGKELKGGGSSQSSLFGWRGLNFPLLSKFIALGDPDVHFCPVRALSRFLFRTVHSRLETQKLLFISFIMVRFRDMSKVSLAEWVSTIARQALGWWQSQAGNVRAVLPFTTARPHEAKDWASTLVDLHFNLLAEVLESAYWLS